jgi:hypothetical protein
MVAIDTTAASRRATLTRIALSAVLVLPIGYVGVLYGRTGVGLPLAIPALYLLWVLGVDAIALTRSTQGETLYRARPAYKWFVMAGVLVFATWLGLLLQAQPRPTV